jgi:hypothetical protein
MPTYPRLQNKRLVKALMDNRHVMEVVFVRAKHIIIADVTGTFTPKEAAELARDLGHEDDAKMVSRAEHNFIVFPQW